MIKKILASLTYSLLLCISIQSVSVADTSIVEAEWQKFLQNPTQAQACYFVKSYKSTLENQSLSSEKKKYKKWIEEEITNLSKKIAEQGDRKSLEAAFMLNGCPETEDVLKEDFTDIIASIKPERKKYSDHNVYWKDLMARLKILQDITFDNKDLNKRRDKLIRALEKDADRFIRYES